MATAYITEVTARPNRFNRENPPIPQFPAVASEKITYTTSTQCTNAFQDNTTILLVEFVEEGWFAVGPDPTATAASPSMHKPAGAQFEIGVAPGDKIAFYDGSS